MTNPKATKEKGTRVIIWARAGQQQHSRVSSAEPKLGSFSPHHCTPPALHLCWHCYITLGSKAGVLYVRLGLSVSYHIADVFQMAAQKSSTHALRMHWHIFVKKINTCLYTFFSIWGMCWKEGSTFNKKTVFSLFLLGHWNKDFIQFANERIP